MAKGLRTLIFNNLNHFSSHCCGFKPSSGHVRQAKFCLRCGQVVFLRDHQFSSHLTTQLLMSEIILTGHQTQIGKINYFCVNNF